MVSHRKPAIMIPLSITVAAFNERKKLLKKEKRAAWVRKNREFINEKKRQKERQRKVKL